MRTTLIALLLTASFAHADEAARDPTAWPPALRSAVAAASAASAASGAEPADRAVRQVVFADGRAYVVQRGRRYAVGQQLDGARIERITEQAVWLREAGQVRREPLYGGVEKRAEPSAPATKAVSGAKKSKEKP
ncbi:MULTISPECIES: hypothetical protein [unclassified Roseateles]|uniref:hypothetical protein n=1 Tax=unclassified Roseateles TaxID=2626991 RepID=UPI0006F3A127|nr:MULTISPECIES: hypothetical protein [unclassified Roseateles]KQW43561.1 hypothetical protein ASC81_17505 [Pelomonas sp. Root405]KRA71299.1 hypothetical protein ASD88_16025 [Pelomonas sp. Root662]